MKTQNMWKLAAEEERTQKQEKVYTEKEVLGDLRNPLKASRVFGKSR